MEWLGVGLGAVVALLWGSSDVFATLATRRLTPFKTTFISHSTGLLMLLIVGTIAFWIWHFSWTMEDLLLSALIGIFTGLCAALASFALYRSLEIGPVAITGPLTATSSAFTLILSALILKEDLTFVRRSLVIFVILGIVFASTSLTDLRILLKKPTYTLYGLGIRWAIVATLAFGALDFGIGLSASVTGWFLPILWTRMFSILFLTLLSWGRYSQPQLQAQAGDASHLSLPSLNDIAHILTPCSWIGSGILLAFLAGILENIAALVFSFDTRIVTTGITSAIASSYSLVVMGFGIFVYRERIAKNQLFGLGMVMISLFLLAL
jgi:drug/metabolite transporter (DMT)-like permease